MAFSDKFLGSHLGAVDLIVVQPTTYTNESMATPAALQAAFASAFSGDPAAVIELPAQTITPLEQEPNVGEVRQVNRKSSRTFEGQTSTSAIEYTLNTTAAEHAVFKGLEGSTVLVRTLYTEDTTLKAERCANPTTEPGEAMFRVCQFTKAVHGTEDSNTTVVTLTPQVDESPVYDTTTT